MFLGLQISHARMLDGCLVVYFRDLENILKIELNFQIFHAINQFWKIAHILLRRLKCTAITQNISYLEEGESFFCGITENCKIGNENTITHLVLRQFSLNWCFFFVNCKTTTILAVAVIQWRIANFFYIFPVFSSLHEIIGYKLEKVK